MKTKIHIKFFRKNMACQFFRGKYLADRMLSNIKQEVFKRQVRPKLLAVLVGEDPASQVYVRHKENACNHVGIGIRVILFLDISLFLVITYTFF
jgi:5,10-methylene-tetrahydrofolate dehydrogenase/methenyl tetrahydrofolate cyclohydrolase